MKISINLFTTLLLVSLAAKAEPLPLLTAPNQARMQIVATADREVQIVVDGRHRLEDCKAYLASRADGATTWEEERAAYKVIQQDGNHLVLQAVFARVTAAVTLERVAPNRYGVSGVLRNTSQQALELARFHYLDGQTSNSKLKLLNLGGGDHSPTTKLVPQNESFANGWRPAGIEWLRLDDPMRIRPNIGLWTDVGALAEDLNTPGFVFGFTGPGTAFGEVGIRTNEPVTPFYVAVRLDAVLLKPSESRGLENAIISFGDPQDELRNWAHACREALGPARVKPPMVGYCSWYQLSQHVKPADIRKAIAEFDSFPTPPGGKTIQIDDGFQVMPGDWSGRGEWKTELSKLPAEMEAKNFIPGLWVAPTAIQDSHPIVREHPDWLQRDAKGEFCVSFRNWKNFGPKDRDNKTYFLEPDHPEARVFIRKTLQDLRAQGWRYFKIDFTTSLSDGRSKYDRSQTTFQSLRSQWQLFREVLGEQALINACTGDWFRFVIGSADFQRVTGDIFPKPDRVRKAIGGLICHSHVNGVWFQADPDVYFLRQNTDLNFEQAHLLAGTQGLLGGAFLTSDFPSQWDAASNAVVRRYWNDRGPIMPAAMRLHVALHGRPHVLAVAYDRQHYALGFYNWDDVPRDVSIRLADLYIPDADGFTAKLDSAGEEPVVLRNGVLTITDQPPGSLRIVRLESVQP